MKPTVPFLRPLFIAAAATFALHAGYDGADPKLMWAGTIATNPAAFGEIPEILSPQRISTQDIKRPDVRLVWHSISASQKLQKVRLLKDTWNDTLCFIDDASNLYVVNSDGSYSEQPMLATPNLRLEYLDYLQYLEVFTKLNERLERIRIALGEELVGNLVIGASHYKIRVSKEDGYLWTFDSKTDKDQELVAYLLLLYGHAKISIYRPKQKKILCIPYTTKELIS